MVSSNEVVVTTNCYTIVMDKALEVVCPALVTWTVKLLVPSVVGVPEITPAADKLSPAGSDPLDTDQV